MGYATAVWLGFGEALAAVAGAPTGLLFVAVSVKSGVLAASRSLSARAAQTLVLFMTSVIVAVVLVAPQPPAALGWELLAVAAASGTALLVLDLAAGSRQPPGRGPVHRKVLPQHDHRRAGRHRRAHLLAQRPCGGLYWLIPAALASLLGGVINAWQFLVRPTS